MINGKFIGIDARMIEMSGIGTYIQHLLGQGIYDYAIGVEENIRKYDKKVKIISFDAPIYGLKEQFQYPVRAIKRAKINVMHFPHYNVPHIYKGKYAVTIHDLIHIIFPDFLGNKVKSNYAKYLMKRAVTGAEQIFTVSIHSKEDIKKYFRVEEDKVMITYNAVDKDFCKKKKSEITYLHEKFRIPSDKKVLLYVGNLKPHKNLSILLDMIKRMNRTDIVLILVGKAFKNINLENLEREMCISNKVIHTGNVEKRELIDLYNLADVFVFPSLYEGFGIPLLEAMACGTPVIAANNSSIPEVVGDAGMLVDAHNIEDMQIKVSEMLDNIELRNEYVQRGYCQTGKFSWSVTADVTRETLGKI